MEIIAKNLSGFYLMKIDETDGFIFHPDLEWRSSVMDFNSFLARSYWEDISQFPPEFDFNKIYNRPVEI